MVDRNTTIACFRCKKQTNMGDLRADVDGKNWICKECYNSLFQKKKQLSYYATKDLLEHIGKKK
ncbi:hypothetical protein HYV88_00895 [Candidatus Woesearchaeota archaeon]|nr:hypothetical protein [Candidatus Woesearchaeota archaeon]